MGSDHTNLERLTRKYVETEIEAAETCLRLAATAYGYGNRAQGDANVAKAEQACANIKRCLDEASTRGWNVSDAHRHLRALCEAVRQLMRRVNEGNWPPEAAA